LPLASPPPPTTALPQPLKTKELEESFPINSKDKDDSQTHLLFLTKPASISLSFPIPIASNVYVFPSLAGYRFNSSILLLPLTASKF
jgi:hypothetical protein